MKQTKIGNRFIVIGGAALANEKTADRGPASRRANSRRIVVIKNGELIGTRRGR